MGEMLIRTKFTILHQIVPVSMLNSKMLFQHGVVSPCGRVAAAAAAAMTEGKFTHLHILQLPQPLLHFSQATQLKQQSSNVLSPDG